MSTVRVNLNGIDELLFPTGVTSAVLSAHGKTTLNLQTLELQTNGTDNFSQTLLNLESGSNINVTNVSGGNVSFALGGPATGDLSGTYPAPSVVKVNGASIPVSTALLASNSSGQLVAATVPLTVAQGGTATATAPSAGQLPIAQSTTAYAPKSVSGDGTLAVTGALVVTKTAGVSFSPSATIDATNAANISSGTLSAARLPATTSVAPSIRTVTTSATVLSSDHTLKVNASGGPVTVTLNVPTNGQIVAIKKIDASANAVTVTGGTIDGASSLVLTSQWVVSQIQFDPVSATWSVL